MMYYLASTTLLEADFNYVSGRFILAPFVGSILAGFGGRFEVRN